MSAPLPPRWPSWHLFGHMPHFLRDPVDLFQQARAQQGDVVRFRLAHIRALAVSDPGAIKRILVSNAGNYSKNTAGYAVLRKLLGQGLVTAQGADWKRKRRIANPAFHRRCIAGFAETMNTATAAAIERWAAAPGPRDLADDMTRLTLRIAGETLFHVDLADEADHVGQAVREALSQFNAQVANPVPFADRLPTASNKRLRAAVDELDRIVHEIIDGRRTSGESVPDLLGMLMDTADDETGSTLSDTELRDEVVTMLLAGHETTANALAWALWLLGSNPDAQEAAAAEVRRVAPDGPIDLAVAAELPLLRRCMQESLRLYPPIWLLARMTEGVDELGGFTIPKGTYIFFSPLVVHRHAEWWPDPERFDPDRFLPEVARTRPDAAYLPFSTGARKCIGDRFAEIEMLVVLGQLLRRFRVERVSEAHPGLAPSVTLRPKDGVQARLVPREG